MKKYIILFFILLIASIAYGEYPEPICNGVLLEPEIRQDIFPGSTMPVDICYHHIDWDGSPDINLYYSYNPNDNMYELIKVDWIEKTLYSYPYCNGRKQIIDHHNEGEYYRDCGIDFQPTNICFHDISGDNEPDIVLIYCYHGSEDRKFFLKEAVRLIDYFHMIEGGDR